MLRVPRRMYTYQNYVKEFQICKQHVNEESLRDDSMGVMTQRERKWDVNTG